MKKITLCLAAAAALLFASCGSDEDLNTANLESAMSMIAGTCRSMGVVVEE